MFEKIYKMDLYGLNNDPNKYICLNCFNISLILWDNNTKATCNNCSITFTKDELIDKLKIYLNSKEYYLKIIDHGLPDPNFISGGVSETNQKIECPLCKNKFVQHVSSGCFMNQVNPRNCPNCGFNNSLYILKWTLEK